MHVWICQCLCPQRHAILAASGEADNVTGAAGLTVELRLRLKGNARQRRDQPMVRAVPCQGRDLDA